MAQHLQFIFPIFYDHFRPNNIFWLGPGKTAKTGKRERENFTFYCVFLCFFFYSPAISRVTIFCLSAAAVAAVFLVKVPKSV